MIGKLQSTDHTDNFDGQCLPLYCSLIYRPLGPHVWCAPASDIEQKMQQPEIVH